MHRFGSLASLSMLVSASGALFACTIDPPPVRPDAGRIPFVDGGFACLFLEAEACVNNAHHYCIPDGEFYQVQVQDCAASGLVCVEGLWCTTCRPGTRRCSENVPQRCNDEGTMWIDEEACDIGVGEACVESRCRNLCEEAIANRSYEGCEFYAVDLDNASLGAGRDASAQQYALVVSNPGRVATEVFIEHDRGTYGGEDVVEVLESVMIAPVIWRCSGFPAARWTPARASRHAPPTTSAPCPTTVSAPAASGPGPARATAAAETRGARPG